MNSVILKKQLLALALLFITALAYAESSECPVHYAYGQRPEIINNAIRSGFKELCSKGFAVGYSPQTRNPIWSAEFITREHLSQKQGLKRINSFREDTRIAESERAFINDYKEANRHLENVSDNEKELYSWDRGHMTPSADAWSPLVQYETFVLSNIVPQNSNNNRHLHAAIEKAVRTYVENVGDVYVITGPIYEGVNIQRIGVDGGRVAIPTHIYKLVYDPQKMAAAAYLEKNAPGFDYEVLTVDQLNSKLGIKMLPGVKAQFLELPQP